MIYHFNKTNPRKNKHLKIKSVVKGLPLFFGKLLFETFSGWLLYLQMHGKGAVCINCKYYVFSQKEKEKEPTTIIPVQPAYIAEQLSLF